MKKINEQTKELILRKLYLLRLNSADYRLKSFTRNKIYLKQLINEGYLNEDLSLTSKSKIKLFNDFHKHRIKLFKEMLIELGYNPIVFDYYLESINLDEQVLLIFDHQRFNKFYWQYMKKPKNGLLEYQKIKQDNLLFHQANLFKIAGCHPNQVFKNKPVSNDEPEIKAIESWEISPELYEIATKISIECPEDALKFLEIERKKLLAKKKNIPRHLVIIDYTLEPIARGIIKLDEEGYSYVYNPDYINNIQQLRSNKQNNGSQKRK